MSCGSCDGWEYIIRLSDQVFDRYGNLLPVDTAERIAYRLNYPVSLIWEAAECISPYIYPNTFEVGLILCLPDREAANNRIREEEVEAESSNEQGNQAQNGIQQQEELYRSTDVPDYMLRTEEDFLRYVWVVEFGRSLSEFDVDEARTLITSQFVRVLMDMYDYAATWGIATDGLPSEVQTFLQKDRTSAEQDLNALSIADLLAFFEKASSTIVPILEDVAVIPEDALLFDYYQQTYNNIHLLEEGQIPSTPIFSDYQRDLATEAYLNEYLEERSNRLDVLTDFVLSAAQEGYILTGFTSAVASSWNDINNQLSQELGENWNPNDFADLANRLVDDYWYQKGMLEQDVGSHVNEHTGTSEDLARDLGIESSADVVAYNDALALDGLRRIAYDPAWNPAQDTQALEELLTAVEAMPRSILGVDVGWVQDGMRSYYDLQKRIHDWRMGLKADVDQIELQMLNEQEHPRDALWWLGVVAETVLGFFDIFDIIFSIRDALRGDIWALGFLAADLLLPFIGDAIMNIRRAGNAMDTTSDVVGNFVKRTDDLVDETFARNTAEAATNNSPRNLGARNTSDFANDQHRGLGDLANTSQLVTREGIDGVIAHLDSPWLDDALNDPANAMMVQRLEDALASGTPIQGADLSFYLHELAESEILDDLVRDNPTLNNLINEDYPLAQIDPYNVTNADLRDVPISDLPPDVRKEVVYRYAHERSLDRYNVSRYSLYDLEVLTANKGLLSQAYIDFWKNFEQ